MQNYIDNYNYFYKYYCLTLKIYENITYIGSISASLIIYILLYFFNQCGTNSHIGIHYLALIKCFLLYNSSYLELLHHYIQYYSLQLLFNPNIDNCNEDTIKGMKIIYYLLFTPIFNNIKYYIPLNYPKIRFTLDGLTCIAFFYYRVQFNYYFWIDNGFTAMNNFININDNIQNKVYASIVLQSIFNIFCFMNVYWGYKIIKILKYKLCNIIKHD